MERAQDRADDGQFLGRLDRDLGLREERRRRDEDKCGEAIPGPLTGRREGKGWMRRGFRACPILGRLGPFLTALMRASMA